MSTFWDYIKPKQKRDRHEKEAEREYWKQKARDEDAAPRKPFTQPVYGTVEWHHKSKKRYTCVPMPIYGVNNGRGMGVDPNLSDKCKDSSVSVLIRTPFS